MVGEDDEDDELEDELDDDDIDDLDDLPIKNSVSMIWYLYATDMFISQIVNKYPYYPCPEVSEFLPLKLIKTS